MICIENKSECCGCGACYQACPNNCIVMTTDAEGFFYPIVDQEKCVDCNICNNVCPIENVKKICDDTGENPEAYGGYHKNNDIRQDSSSGGAFTLFAKEILDNGGKVFGCMLNENMKAVHVGIEHVEELTKLRGSKYVQSNIGDSYNEVKTSIQKGQQVLFVGTPCQAAGLYSFMGNKVHEKLFIADFICHGVPSPKVFDDYIHWEERKRGSRIISHRFRNKDHGWSQTGLQLGTCSEFEDGKIRRRYPAFTDAYMNAFLDDVCLRPSCHDCAFKCISKPYADVTIADFWGVDKVAPELNDKMGTSLLLVNTDHGKVLWEKVREHFNYKEVDFERAVRRNKPLVRSANYNPRRERFYKDYQEKGFAFVEKKYMSAFTWAWHRALNVGKSVFLKFEQFAKFAIVGCSNTFISLAVYYLCCYCGMHYLAAYTLGFLASVCNAFYWNNKYIFKNKQEKSVVKAFLKALTVYGFSYLLSIALMSFMVECLKISSIIAPILKLVITIPLNFFLNKVWAFKDKKK